MDNNSYKDMTRGTRRHYTKIKQEVFRVRFERRRITSTPYWIVRSNDYTINRGYKNGLCGCYDESSKSGKSCVVACNTCRKYIRAKAGELSLDDSWELLDDYISNYLE